MEQKSQERPQECVQEWKMSFLHAVMINILKPIMRAGSTSSELKLEGGVSFRCFPIELSSCCDILDGKHMLCGKHSPALKILSVRFMEIMENFWSLRCWRAKGCSKRERRDRYV